MTNTLLKSGTALCSALFLSATAHAQLPGPGGPPMDEKFLGEGVNGSAVFSHFGKAVSGVYTHSDKLDVATLKTVNSGPGKVFLMSGLGNYDGVFAAKEPGTNGVSAHDLATLANACPDGLDAIATTSNAGIGCTLYNYNALQFEDVVVLGSPYGDAKWIASGHLGGGPGMDLVFSRGSNTTTTELVILEDVSITEDGNGDLVGIYGNLRTIQADGEVFALCTLNFDPVTGSTNGYHEIAVNTSTGTYVFGSGGSLLATFASSGTGDFLTPRVIDPGAPVETHSLLVVGEALGHFYAQEHDQGGSTTPALLGPLDIQSITTADFGEGANGLGTEARADLVGKSALGERPFIFYYNEDLNTRFSLSNADWYGGTIPTTADPTNRMLFAGDVDRDGDADIVTGSVANSSWVLMRNATTNGFANTPGLYDPPSFAPPPCFGDYDYEAAYDDNNELIGLGGHLTLGLGQPTTWPSNIPDHDPDLIGVFVRVWILPDGNADAEQELRHQEIYDVVSIGEGLLLSDIEVYTDWADQHDLVESNGNEVLSLEICLVEATDTDDSGERTIDEITDRAPTTFLMFAGNRDTKNDLRDRYLIPSTAIFRACLTTNLTIPNVERSFYTCTGCQNFGQPPYEPPF